MDDKFKIKNDRKEVLFLIILFILIFSLTMVGLFMLAYICDLFEVPVVLPKGWF